MKPFFLILCSLLLTSACKEAVKNRQVTEQTTEAYTPTAPSFEQLQGLIGSWKDALGHDTSRVYENWTQTGENTLSGIGYVLSGHDTIHIEHLKITLINEEFLFTVNTGSQVNTESVRFLLMPSDPDSLVFYSNMHDFPQKILYAKENDSWRVTASNSSGKELKFHLVPHTADGSS